MGCGGSKPAGAPGADKPAGAPEIAAPAGDKSSSTTTQAMAKVHTEQENVNIEDLYEGVPLDGRNSNQTPLGTGGTASVYKVKQRSTGKEFALKVVSLGHFGRDQEKKDMLLREIGLIKMLDHPNVVKVFEVFQTVSVLYIVMELCTGGELFDKLYEQVDEEGNVIAQFSEADAHFLATKMIASLSYLHTNGIVHRDLKLENFIFTDETNDAEIKLIDFGFSRRYEKNDDVMTNPIGTCYYMAPEVIAQHYTDAADLWSVGVVIFMMLTGRVPFQGKDDTNEAIIHAIQEATLDGDGASGFTLKKSTPLLKKRLTGVLARSGPKIKGKATSLSPECIEFVLGLLTVDIDARLTAAQAMNTAWIKMESSKVRGRKQSMGVVHESEEEIEEENNNLVANLKKFRNNSKLKRSALMAVSFNLTSAELKQLAKQFTEMDTNSDGIITMAEFASQMSKLGMENAEIKAAFSAIDQDQTGILKYSEFIAAAIDEKEFDEDHEVEAAFRRLDLDESGSLDVDDLRQLLPKNLSEEAITRILDQADFQKDGKIDLAEFKMVMQGKVAKLSN